MTKSVQPPWGSLSPPATSGPARAACLFPSSSCDLLASAAPFGSRGAAFQAGNFTFRMVKLRDATKFEDPDSAGRGAGDRATRHHRAAPGGGGRGGRPD